MPLKLCNALKPTSDSHHVSIALTTAASSRQLLGEITFATTSRAGHEYTAPYAPHQNGFCERQWRTIFEGVRVMLTHSGAPPALWPYAAQNMVHIRNRVINKGLHCTPYEALHAVKRDLAHLRDSFVRVENRPTAGKVAQPERANRGIYLGRRPDMAADRIWMVDAKGVELQIKNSTNVTYHEGSFEFANNLRTRLRRVDAPAVKHNLRAQQAGGAAPTTAPPSSSSPAAPDAPAAPAVVDAPPPPRRSARLQGEEAGPALVHPGDAKSNLTNVILAGMMVCSMINGTDACNQCVDSTFALQSLVLHEDSLIRRANYEGGFSYNASLPLDANDPLTYNEICNRADAQEWYRAADIEIAALESNNTFELVDPADIPNGQRPIRCKWVFKTKVNSDGTLDKRKARLCAKGCSQRFGVDYQETFSPTARITTFRLICSLAAQCDWHLYHMDVKSAYLYADMEETVFMEAPDGYKERVGDTDRNYVWQLKRSLYGLKQAGRNWGKEPVAREPWLPAV